MRDSNKRKVTGESTSLLFFPSSPVYFPPPIPSIVAKGGDEDDRAHTFLERILVVHTDGNDGFHDGPVFFRNAQGRFLDHG
jgi:hypothetical protein